MSCENDVCGTGDWVGPKPGDPSNNVSLSANTVLGGINVSWSYPTVNPYAVAHTLLFRGATANFTDAVQQAIVAGSVYYDKLNPTINTEYFYWIQIVSINGTTAEAVGPTSAIAQPVAEQTLETLSGLINTGMLAQELRADINNITLVNGVLSDEIRNRIAAFTGLGDALTRVQQGVDQSMTYVNQEIQQRKDANSALVTALNGIASAVAQNNAMILQEQTVRSTKDSALATDVTTLFAKAATNAAAITTANTARANGDSALASQISTAQTTLNNNLASAQTQLQTKIDTTNGKVTSIGALYTAKVQVNGLVGGFGVYNDGSSVSAGFDVTQFYVGSTSANKVKPFIIDTVSGITYIDKARIKNADIDTLKIAGGSVIVGQHADGFANTVPANGQTILIGRTLDLGVTNNSGLIVVGTAGIYAGTDGSFILEVWINHVQVGRTGQSLHGGYVESVSVTGFASNVGQYPYVELVLRNASSGPGSNVSGSVEQSTMAMFGGKR